MALALLRYLGRERGKHRFRVDLGTNRYFQYAVGGEDVVRRHGIAVLAEPSYASELLGPLVAGSLGRTELEIDEEKFDREHRRVQIQSFRDAQRNGPAFSDVITLPVTTAADEDLTISFAIDGEPNMNTSAPLRVKPFTYRDTRYSNAMFLGALVNMLPQILPTVAPLVSSLIGNIFPSGGAAARTTQGVLNTLGNDENAQRIANLIQQIGQLAQGGGATSAAAPVPTPTQTTATTQAGALALRTTDVAPNLVHAQALPIAALVSALPALAPLLQQVLNPQTLQTVLDAPSRHTQTIINGLRDLGQLGAQIQAQQDQHLERLNPGVNDDALDRLLMSMSMSFAQDRLPKYKRVAAVRLQFSEAPAINVHGENKLLYRHGNHIAFPLLVNTPRTINSADIVLVVKERESLRPVLRKKITAGTVENGALTVMPTIEAADMQRLKPSRDYLINVHLVWKNKEGQQRGTSVQKLITLTAGYLFDRVEEGGEIRELTNFNEHREYWHKIWEGRFSDETKRYEFEAKYYYLLKPENNENARLETKIKVKEQDRKQVGRMRTGMEISPAGLNRLRAQMAPELAPLTEDELRALEHDDFVQRFNTSAVYRAKFRGRSGERAQFWVYPVVKRQKVILQRVDGVDEHGQVNQLSDHVVEMPMPVQVHFVGVKS